MGPCNAILPSSFHVQKCWEATAYLLFSLHHYIVVPNPASVLSNVAVLINTEVPCDSRSSSAAIHRLQLSKHEQANMSCTQKEQCPVIHIKNNLH